MFEVLVVNVGSTSLKYKLLDMEHEVTLAAGKIERVGSSKSYLTHSSAAKEKITREVKAPNQAAAIELVMSILLDAKSGAIGDLSQISAVGFKTVHAGPITGSLLLTDEVVKAMEEYCAVVPAHNPPYITAIRIFQKLMPRTPLVGVFETSFHSKMPDYAYIYALPYEWYEKYGIRKYGFHGASHRYVSQRVPQILGRAKEDLKIISCHLGGSSSVCAIENGVSVDTSMGFSTQSGLPMSNRCGDIDPMVIPYIMQKQKLTASQVTEVLTKKSGLLGISGVSGDIRDLERAAESGHARAALALEVFVHETKKLIGAYAALMGGVDAIAFTGGIGENAVNVRKSICENLEFLGAKMDNEKNAKCKAAESIISQQDSKVKLLVIPANEELIVARETLNVVRKTK